MNTSYDNTTRFKFTPVAGSKKKKKITRLWDRNPSTPFAARSKSHKIWKRLRTLSSTNNMDGATGLQKETMEYDDELLTEISRSGNANYIRGVKRLRMLDSMKERSFLETKWELEVSTRKRKFPAPANLHAIEAFMEFATSKQESPLPVEDSCEDNRFTQADGDTPRGSATLEEDEDLKNVTKLGVDNSFNVFTEPAPVDELEEESEDEEQGDLSCKTTSPTDESITKDGKSDVVAPDREPVVNVPTTLKLSTLAGDDAELFSEFLSRAKAKREANCGMTPKKITSLAEPDPETHSPTPSRRALEQLDKNSPTPQKQLRSTTKSEALFASTTQHADMQESVCNEKVPDETSTATCRRSKRTRTAKAPPAHAPPNVPQQIPVRRANGTEFIFLKRTEAQQIALTTRANTKRNKGNSQMPKYKLKAMAKEQGETAEEIGGPATGDSAAPLGKPIGKKQVSWNDEHLVQYADGREPEDNDRPVENQGESGRDHSNNSSQLPKRVSTPTATKRVRRLGTPSSSSVISSTSGHTPMPKRTKLAPRSPKVDATLSSSAKGKKTLTGRRKGQFLPVRSGSTSNQVK